MSNTQAAICPQCRSITVSANLGGGIMDHYCEECGWPHENRLPQATIDRIAALERELAQSREIVQKYEDRFFSVNAELTVEKKAYADAIELLTAANTELAAAKEELKEFHRTEPLKRSELAALRADLSESNRQRDHLRASLAELRKVAEGLDYAMSAGTNGPDLFAIWNNARAAFAAWKARNPE